MTTALKTDVNDWDSGLQLDKRAPPKWTEVECETDPSVVGPGWDRFVAVHGCWLRHFPNGVRVNGNSRVVGCPECLKHT